MDHIDPVNIPNAASPSAKAQDRKGPCLRDGCESGNRPLQGCRTTGKIISSAAPAAWQSSRQIPRRFCHRPPSRCGSRLVSLRRLCELGHADNVTRSRLHAAHVPVGKRTRQGHAGLRLPDVPRGAAAGAGTMSKVWNGARSRVASAPRDQDRIHLPDASRDRASRARELSDLRHGSGAAHRDRRRRQSRTARHDAAVLDQPGADRTIAGDCHGQHVVAARVHGRASTSSEAASWY